MLLPAIQTVVLLQFALMTYYHNEFHNSNTRCVKKHFFLLILNVLSFNFSQGLPLPPLPTHLLTLFNKEKESPDSRTKLEDFTVKKVIFSTDFW